MKLAKIMNRFGIPMTVGASLENRSPLYSAFLQPLRYKNKMYLYGVNTEIGYNSHGHYLYIGPPEPDLTLAEEGSFLMCGSEKYKVDRSEKVWLEGKPLYIWAVVRTIVEA